ncbi:CGNR zinc finger domain-containing protein [Streptomyces sp. NPDC053541]|uniref:CGNR zinc finger domain-containing protein n=1 Tax=Streptomyces sp. NPDC053541 TaxID=3365709 RepID=UPI0037D36857
MARDHVRRAQRRHAPRLTPSSGPRSAGTSVAGCEDAGAACHPKGEGDERTRRVSCSTSAWLLFGDGCPVVRCAAVGDRLVEDFPEQLAERQGDRLVRCRCAGLFLDTSRGASRRWCSMNTCGNRVKKARLANK